MDRLASIDYLRPALYVRWEAGKWSSFGPMPLYKAVLLAVGKYRINHEPWVLSDGLNLVGIDSILAMRQRADFPWRVEDFASLSMDHTDRGKVARSL